MMPKKDEKIEYKKSTEKLKEGVYSICAMLNRSGSGTLYFGINKNGEIVGQQIGSDIMKTVSKEIREHIEPRIEPVIEAVNVEGKNVIKITFSGDDYPYSAYYRYMIRNGDEDAVLTNDQLGALFEKKRNTSWESVSSGLDIESVSEDTLITFFEQGNESGRLRRTYTNKEKALSDLGLLTNEGHLNNAGRILFSDDRPIRIRLAVFSDDGRSETKYSDQFDGNLFECLGYGTDFIRDNIDNLLPDDDEPPLDIIREIVVNSLVHREYDTDSVNVIEFTPRSLCVTNPGCMPEGKNPRSFSNGNYASMPHNPLIAHALYAGGYMDSMGAGFQRVYGKFENTDIECSFVDDDEFFRFELMRTEPVDGSQDIEGLSREENIVFGELREDGRRTISEICIKHNLTVGVANRVVRDLRNKGLIRREGSNKNGTWIIIR